MATYTPLSSADVRPILSRYPLGELVSLEALPGGQANSSFKLETEQGAFVLSICDEKPLSQVVTLCQVLDMLEAYDFPTQRVIKTHSAEGVITANGKPLFIKTYIPGQVPEKATPEMLVQVGRQLARLHRIPAPDGIPQQFAYGLECFDEVLNSRQSAEYCGWLADKQAYLQDALSADVPRCMIHGDLFYDNTLFNGPELKAILDFEEVCVYFRAFDIGMCLAGFCILDQTISLEKIRALVSGYQRETPLTAQEKQRLQDFAVMGAAATSFWRFRQYNMLFPESALASSHREMDRLADQLASFSRQEFQDAVFGAEAG